MKRLAIASAMVASLLSGFFTTAHAKDGPGIPADTEKNVRERVDSGGAVGIILGVIDPRGTSYFSHGKVSKQSDRQPDKNTIFEIGSITKAFTSVALADLVERGTVKLDDPIDEYLPKNVKAPARNGKRITLKDLATHRSGLPRLPTNFTPAKPENPYADYTADRLYEFLSSYTLTRDIGEKYEYSNVGAGLLGHLLAQAAGSSYEDLIVGHICRPLGMLSTRITLSPKQVKRLAKGHAGGKQVRNWDLDALAGAGALRSSANDMLRFVQAAMGLGKTKLQPAFERSLKERYETDEPGLKTALGWHVWTKFGTEIVWHNGGTGGYHSFCGFVPARKVGVVVLTNSTEDIDDIGLHLLEPQYALEPVRKELPVATQILDQYVGYYELAPGVIFDVKREGKRLAVKLTGQERYPVYAESETKFFYRIVDAQLTFTKNDASEVTSVTLHQNGIDQTARKLGPEYTPPAPRVEVEVERETLKRYVGQYELAPGAVVDVRLDNNKLTAQLTGQPRFPIFPESETKFFYKIVDAQLTFVKNPEGKVTGLVLHQNRQNLPAKKIK